MAPLTISRTRTGCWACRARRVKCDETHPVCRRCARNNRCCEYSLQLTWLDESIAKGVCHGRAGVWSKNGRKRKDVSNEQSLEMVRHTVPKASHQQWMFLNTSADDVNRLCMQYQTVYGGILPSHQRRLILSPALNTMPATASNRSREDQMLLAFFEAVICSSSTLVDNVQSNPYRYLILPMALNSDGIYHAALAISANTLRLSKVQSRDWSNWEMDEILGLVLMLCWFEISDHSRSSWVTHLNGFQDVMSARKQRHWKTSSQHSQELLGFFDRYFAFHLVLARTAFRWDGPRTHPCLSALPSSPSSEIIDPYMGFSHALLLLINEVTDLAWQEHELDIQKVYGLKHSLEVLRQTPPHGDINLHSGQECMVIAEANRLGAILLLSEEKLRYVRQILDLIQAHKSNMMRTAVLPLWPLFLAGCCVSDDNDRVIVLQIFQEWEAIRRFGNIAPAREVIEMVWRRRDLNQNEFANGAMSGKTARFEWEHAMTMLGGLKLALT
ncbi:transcriptional regulator family: Fungal Specific TF [Aspergillus niger]|nr:transcriptional regulator family: Fungal Specific TF [Aspergillus niger]